MALGRKTGGRQKGTPNKATAEIKELAQMHGWKAVQRLAALIDSPDERVAIAACQALLDRGYGKAHQSMDINSDREPRDIHSFTDAELDALIQDALQTEAHAADEADGTAANTRQLLEPVAVTRHRAVGDC